MLCKQNCGACFFVTINVPSAYNGNKDTIIRSIMKGRSYGSIYKSGTADIQ